MVNWTKAPGCIKIDGDTYRLQQSHWHSPAEHTIYGVRHPLEMHTVFTTHGGKIAVIGVLYKLGREEDPFLSKLAKPLKQMIETQDKEVRLGYAHPDEIDRHSSYFRYNGSLTTPPCTQGVIWTLMEEMSNARPVQPINNNKVLSH